MSATNPPPIRVPQGFTKDREVFAYFNDLHTFLRLLWERTGGGEDAVADAADNTLLLSTMSDKVAIASLRQETRSQSVLLFTPDAAKIAVLMAGIADVERSVATLQSLHGKVASGASRLDTHDEYLAYFEILLIAIAGVADAALLLANTGPDAARHAHLNQRINDVELLAWL